MSIALLVATSWPAPSPASSSPSELGLNPFADDTPDRVNVDLAQDPDVVVGDAELGRHVLEVVRVFRALRLELDDARLRARRKEEGEAERAPVQTHENGRAGVGGRSDDAEWASAQTAVNSLPNEIDLRLDGLGDGICGCRESGGKHDGAGW
jgi:hypothetical protein